MITALGWLATLAMAGCMLIWARARRAVKPTTLLGAWNWLVLAWTVWTAVLFFTIAVPIVPPAQADLLWYASAVLMLCPWVAVLGAKRPGSRVWTFFVVIPLILVLGWPAIAILAGGADVRFEIETPTLVGYTLVLVMGVGNYFGTRFTIPALLAGASLLFLASSFWTGAPVGMPRDMVVRVVSTLGLCLAATMTARVAHRASVGRTNVDRLWDDVQDWFGIVWSRRILERVNSVARQDKWPVRLGLNGFVPAQKNETTPEQLAALVEATRPQIEHTFRWLLRRFADEEWIEARLRDPEDTTKHPGSS